MKKNRILLLLIILSIAHVSFSQSILERYSHLGEMYIPQLQSAPFPHADRANGHTYNDKIFSAEEHYSDSSVAIFIPKGFIETSKINFVVYFHGWGSNIDKSCKKFHLIEQFCASNKNAIFIFPEGPKNASDSHSGKMEDKNGFKHLIDDVFAWLISNGKLDSTNIGNIILAGHSGAYRAIAFCLQHGGLMNHVTDVILFDAFYAKTVVYLDWIMNSNGRFINIYTNDGGTKEDTEQLMQSVDSLGISYFQSEEIKLKKRHLSKNRLVFIHTDLKHNEVIAVRKQFQTYLTTSGLESIRKYAIPFYDSILFIFLNM